jgi:hypothetical protein
LAKQFGMTEAPPLSTRDADEDACGLPPELLARIDENLWCRAVNDNQDLPIDLSGALLFQATATVDIQRRLALLESAALTSAPPPWLPALTAFADALFRDLVETLATRPPEAGLSPPAHVTEILERFAATLASLSEPPHADPTAPPPPSMPSRN